MIIVRDLTDVHTLKLQIIKGDILEIYNKHYDIAKYYWVYDGILTAGYGEGDYADYCTDTEFFRDIAMALNNPERYFIKLVEEVEVEPVILEEGALV